MGTARHEPTLETPEGIISEADQQLHEAEALASELEAGARNGDDVTPEQLEDAQKRAGWARIMRDAAAKRAAKRAEELRQEGYRNLLANYLDVARKDVTAEVEAELEQARPHITAALELLRERNRAVYAIAEYASHDVNYKDPEDELFSVTVPGAPGASWFTIRGDQHDFIPATDVAKQLLAPLVQKLRAQSGGVAAEWLDEIR